MTLDYSQPGALKIDMIEHIQDMLDDFPHQVIKTSKAPWNEKLFKVDDLSKKLTKERRGVFHTFAMKQMFICKRGRPDISPGVSYLAMHIKYTNESNWTKLLKMLGFLKGSIEDILTLEADGSQTLTWHINALSQYT